MSSSRAHRWNCLIAKGDNAGLDGPVADASLERRTGRGQEDSACRGPATRAARGELPGRLAAVRGSRGLGDPERVPARWRRAERDPLAAPQAAWAFVLVMRVTGSDIRPRRRCLTLGPGALIGDPRERLIFVRAQHVVTRCFEQQGQHEQEVERESSGGSESHGWCLRRTGGSGRRSQMRADSPLNPSRCQHGGMPGHRLRRRRFTASSPVGQQQLRSPWRRGVGRYRAASCVVALVENILDVQLGS